MNEYDLLDAVGGLDPELVEKAKEPKRQRAHRWVIPAAAAACAALALGLGLLLADPGAGASKQAPRYEADPAPTAKAASIATPAPSAATTFIPDKEMSYVGFIKYNNCNYFYCEDYKYIGGSAAGLVGERLGTVEHVVSPGTPMEEWPDLSSYEKCDFYAVKGFDPSLMICKIVLDRVGIYINHDNDDYATCRDVLENAFHVSEYLTAVEYEGAESLSHGYDEVFALDTECNGVVLDLIAALDEGEWMERPADPDEYLAIADGGRWKLTLSLGGVRISLNVYEDGYAKLFVPFGSEFIRFDKEKLAPLVELLSSGEHGTPVKSMDSFRCLRPEALNSEPNYGKYFPLDEPEGFRIDRVIIFCFTDEVTGEVFPDRPRGLSVEYRGIDDPDSMIRIAVNCIPDMAAFLADLNALDGWLCHAPIDEVSADTVMSLAPDYPNDYEVMAYDENVSITIFTMNSLTPEEIIALMRQCFGK